MTGIQAGARVDNDRYEKESARDFALWKAPKPGEHFWETPIGPGRPGWHIECSAMAMRISGRDDRYSHRWHRSGVSASRKRNCAERRRDREDSSSSYWMHAEHLLVEGEKMSKSLGNFFTLRDLFAKGYKPSALRYALGERALPAAIEFHV